MALKGLRGKVAVVTGAAQGIGAAVAERLLEEGCKLVLFDLADLSDRYRGHEDIVTIRGDIVNEADSARAIELGRERFGAVHLLAHCAALPAVPQHMVDMVGDDFDKLMTVNVKGTMLMMREALRAMRAQQSGGSIVCVASLAVVRGGATRAAYAASKRAILGLTTTAALENGPFGIRVNAISPGPINTEMARKVAASDPAWAASIKTKPLGRLGETHEIAAGIAWLLSEEASFVTGENLLADGGFTLV